MGKITTSSSFVTQKLRKHVRIVVNEWPIIGDIFVTPSCCRDLS
jgi:hypothetical protein